MEGIAVRGRFRRAVARRITHEFDRTGGSPLRAPGRSIPNTSTGVRSRVRTALVVSCFALVVSACGLGTSQQYISSENDDLDFAIPNDFVDLGLAGEGIEWTRAYTGVPDDTGDAPLIRATVFPLNDETRQSADLRGLRVLLLGDRDPLDGSDDLHLVRHEAWVDDNGNEGNRLQVDVLDPAGDTTFAHVAAIDAARTRVAQVQIACSTACFIANIDAIDQILDSVRFDP